MCDYIVASQLCRSVASLAIVAQSAGPLSREIRIPAHTYEYSAVLLRLFTCQLLADLEPRECRAGPDADTRLRYAYHKHTALLGNGDSTTAPLNVHCS